MCGLSSPGVKRQYLAVAHEMGKITRLSCAPTPFTVLSLVSSPCNENFLVVCGLTDYQVPELVLVVDELLSEALSLSSNFLVPSGKIRDVTSVLLMFSVGHIYFQQLCEESSAMSNMMKLIHSDIKDSNGRHYQ